MQSQSLFRSIQESFQEQPEWDWEAKPKPLPAIPSGEPGLSRWAQLALNRVAGERLAPDGDFGTGSKAALLRFQKARGLTATGRLDEPTEKLLRSEMGRTAARLAPRGGGTAAPSTSLAQTVRRAMLPPLTVFASDIFSPRIAIALSIVKLISIYYELPWVLSWVVLEHEGGLALLNKPGNGDGVMQTIKVARESVSRGMSAELMRAILGLAPNDGRTTDELRAAVLAAFSDSGNIGRQLVVQIAFGIHELKQGLSRNGGYVALGFQAYNAGSGSASKFTQRQTGSTAADKQRRAATSLHGFSRGVWKGRWQCDANLAKGKGGGWFWKVLVTDSGGKGIPAAQYLRSVQTETCTTKPSTTCATTGTAVPCAAPGATKTTRNGALDKLFDVTKLQAPYAKPVAAEWPALTDDGSPLMASARTLTAVAALP